MPARARAQPTTQTTLKKPARELFLEALADGVSVTLSCEIARWDRSNAYKLRNADAEFARAWDAALEAGTDKLEDVARTRAMNSSDVLMIFLLKGRRPEKYRERHQLDHSGHVHTIILPVDSDAAETAARVLGLPKSE